MDMEKRLTLNEALRLLSKVSNRKNSIAPRELTRDTNSSGKIKILSYEYSTPKKSGKNNYWFKIKFLNTGYETVRTLNDINSKMIKDPTKANVHGVGYLGDKYDQIRKEDKELFAVLYNRWYNVINRCYSPKHSEYRSYGAKGVHLCDRWLNFSNFYYDVQKLPNFNRDDILNNKITLDKDSLQQDIEYGKIYSKDTCIWLTRKEQQALINHIGKAEKQMKYIYWENINTGEHGYSKGIAVFARERGLRDSHIGDVIKGRRKTCKGYIFRYATAEEIEKYF